VPCDNRAAHGAGINDWMTTIVSQYLYKLLHRQPITSFATFISSNGMSVRSMSIEREELVSYLVVTQP
jgi:hypothetical protein